MSQMPSKIWLHKDTKYSTGDIVCGYQYDFVQGIEDEGGIKNFVEYVPADAFIEKAVNFLNCSLSGVVAIKNGNTTQGLLRTKSEFVESFKKYMKGE